MLLHLGNNAYDIIKAPEDEPGETDIAVLKNIHKDLLKFIVDEKAFDRDDFFAQLPANMQNRLLKWLQVEASQVESVIKAKYGSWAAMIKKYADSYEMLIKLQRIPEVSWLVMQKQALPSKTDLLARYQTALDNDLYKALKALREAQAWRQSKAVISVTPVYPSGDSGGE